MTTYLVVFVICIALYTIGHIVGRAHGLAAARVRAGGKDG